MRYEYRPAMRRFVGKRFRTWRMFKVSLQVSPSSRGQIDAVLNMPGMCRNTQKGNSGKATDSVPLCPTLGPMPLDLNVHRCIVETSGGTRCSLLYILAEIFSPVAAILEG